MEHFSKAFAAATKISANITEVIARTAASAQELLRDGELRSKGLSLVQSRLQGIQVGIQRSAGKLGERLQFNKRQLQGLMMGLEEQIYAILRTRQLHASRRQPVDVQFGTGVFTDAPQEVRARLWYVLLENPHLAAPIKCEQPGVAPNSDLLGPEDTLDTTPRASSSFGPSPTAAAAAAAAGDCTGAGPGPAPDSSHGGRRSAPPALGAAVPADSPSSSASLALVAASALRSARSSGESSGGEVRARSTGSGHGGDTLRQAHEDAPPSAQGTPSRPSREDSASTAPSRPSFAPPPDAIDGWEMIDDMVAGAGPWGLGVGVGPSGLEAGGGPAVPEAVRLIMDRLDALGPQPLDESGSDPLLVAQGAVLQAMLQVPWEPGRGLPADVHPDSRFAMLNQMTAGQEEVDDSILRDIHRTFPEHPYFGLEAGQRALFRVLKAYSLHDLEVAYCQGMAFMAGVLLMYVPEEMAYRLFVRLMEADGPNLRRLYVPGLEPLKAELATFELLLSWRLPELGAHLAEFGLPPVLYVSQWLMTLFATPFPPAFCARVIDVLLQDGHDRLLLRASFAVVEALEAGLLARNDFEALITYLKMEPVQWDLARQRRIMERALRSPITDEEIDVARDTVASRHLIAAAGIAAVAGAGGAAGDQHALSAEQGPERGAEGEGGSWAPQPQPPARAFGSADMDAALTAEVEAALTAAAAALTIGAGEGEVEVEAAGRGEIEAGAGWPAAERQACAGTGGEGAAGRGGQESLIDSYGAGPSSQLYGAAPHGAAHGSELDGEYGEMLLDASALLPPLEQQAGAGAGPGFGLSDDWGPFCDAGRQAQQQQQPATISLVPNLLLD